MPDLPLRRCTHCGTLEPAARQLCAGCGRAALAPTTVDGSGTLVSFTLVRRPAAAFRDLGAIAVVVVALDAGVRVTGRMDALPDGLRPGARMALLRLDDAVPVFVAAAPGTGN
jgi:uncharacterized OB-fold protein